MGEASQGLGDEWSDQCLEGGRAFSQGKCPPRPRVARRTEGSASTRESFAARGRGSPRHSTTSTGARMRPHASRCSSTVSVLCAHRPPLEPRAADVHDRGDVSRGALTVEDGQVPAGPIGARSSSRPGCRSPAPGSRPCPGRRGTGRQAIRFRPSTPTGERRRQRRRTPRAGSSPPRVCFPQPIGPSSARNQISVTSTRHGQRSTSVGRDRSDSAPGGSPGSLGGA